jgi:hypothetical protein
LVAVAVLAITLVVVVQVGIELPVVSLLCCLPTTPSPWAMAAFLSAQMVSRVLMAEIPVLSAVQFQSLLLVVAVVEAEAEVVPLVT